MACHILMARSSTTKQPVSKIPVGSDAPTGGDPQVTTAPPTLLVLSLACVCVCVRVRVYYLFFFIIISICIICIICYRLLSIQTNEIRCKSSVWSRLQHTMGCTTVVLRLDHITHPQHSTIKLGKNKNNTKTTGIHPWSTNLPQLHYSRGRI